MVERFKSIGQQTGVSLVVVCALLGVAYQAGTMGHRVMTLEAGANRTEVAVDRLTQIATQTDRRLILLERDKTIAGISNPDAPFQGLPDDRSR